jgi:hypothetical protein
MLALQGQDDVRGSASRAKPRQPPFAANVGPTATFSEGGERHLSLQPRIELIPNGSIASLRVELRRRRRPARAIRAAQAIAQDGVKRLDG